jgi:predicted Zn-dependent protease
MIVGKNEAEQKPPISSCPRKRASHFLLSPKKTNGTPAFAGVTLLILLLTITNIVHAATPALAPNQKLEACLKKAEDLPDIAAADAELWFKKGGGENARFCHAAAQFNRGEYTLAGRGFASLAAMHDKNDARHAAQLHARAGLSFMRADDGKNADKEYAAALKLEPDDPEIWMDRATYRASTEHYWDAISDLNHAVKIAPDMSEALRLRGQAWLKLGDTKNADADFIAAEDIEAAEQAKKK